jgi:hypothetical protein
MSNLEFTSFGGPSLPHNSGEVIGILESGSSYREGSPHSSLLREAKDAVAGIHRYIKEYCRPHLGKQKTNDYSPTNSKEFTSRASNAQ